MNDTEAGDVLVHWAAPWLRYETQLRQRCGWCGAVLVDVDLANIAMPTEQAEAVDPDDLTCGYPVWTAGEMVAVAGAGGMSWQLEPEPSEEGEGLLKMPDHACARLPHDVTGSTPASWAS